MGALDKCHICNSNYITDLRHPGIDGDRYECEICGHVLISGTAIAVLSKRNLSSVDRAKFSHMVRNLPHTDTTEICINAHHIDQIKAHQLPKPVEQLDLLVRHIGDQSDHAGANISIYPDRDYAVIGAVGIDGMSFVLEEAVKRKLLVTDLKHKDVDTYGFKKSANYSLTFDGWDAYSKSQKGKASQGYAFMAMKFGESELEEFYESVLKPAVRETGYELRDVRETAKAGLIDVRLLVQIQNSDFVLADLSHGNNGAYWEAGYAQGLGKPVIYICEKSRFEDYKTHFDTNHYYTLIWDAGNPDDCRDELMAVIQNTLST